MRHAGPNVRYSEASAGALSEGRKIPDKRPSLLFSCFRRISLYHSGYVYCVMVRIFVYHSRLLQSSRVALTYRNDFVECVTSVFCRNSAITFVINVNEVRFSSTFAVVP